MQSRKIEPKGGFSMQPYTVALIAAAAIPALWVGFRAARRLTRGGAKGPDPTKSTEWTTAQVVAFLEVNHLSPQCVAAFKANDIDGSVLFQLESYHLSDMGVKKLKDRILFQKCVEAIRPAHLERERSDSTRSQVSSDDDAPAPAVHARGVATSPSKAEKKNALTPIQTKGAASADDRSKVLGAVIAKLQGIYEQCASEAFLHANPAEQMQVIRLAKSELAQILTITKTFPPEEVAHVMPLTQQLTAMLDGVERELQNAAERGPEESNKINAQGQAALLKLHSMLDGFLEALSSASGADLPQEDRERLALNISSHVSKSLEVASVLPESEQNGLKRKCETVLRAAKALATGAPLPRASPTPPEQKQPASLQFLIRRVRAVFETLKSDQLMSLPAADRTVILEKMRGEIASIEREAEHLSEQEKAVMGQVFVNVKQVLQQLASLTVQESEMVSLQAQKNAASEQVAARADAAPQGNPVVRISDSIKQVLEVLKKPEFLQSPPEVQLRNCEAMLNRLQELSKELQSLPPPIQQAVMPMLVKVSELVHSVYKHAAEASSKGAPQAPTQPAPATTQPGPASDSKHKLAHLAKDSTEEFAAVVGRLKEVYDFVSSDAFEQAPQSVRAKQSVELLAFVNKVAALGRSLPPAENNAIEELTAPLMRLLEHVSGTAPASAPTAPAAPASAPKAAAAPAGPSKEFQTIVESLQQVFGVVNSERFQAAPAAPQREIAAKLSAHVEAMVPHFKELAEDERRTVMKFVEPLRKLLKALTKDEAQDNENPQPVEEEEEEGSEQPDGFSDFVMKLRSLMQVITGDAFVKAPRDRRLKVAAMLLQEVSSLQRDLAGLSPAQRQQVQPALAQLMTLLRQEVSPAEDVQEQDDEPFSESEEGAGADHANGADDRKSRFAAAMNAIRDMRSRTLTFDELQEKLNLLDEIDGCGISTQEELSIRALFHKELEQAIRKLKNQHGIPLDDDEKEDDKEEEVDEDDEQDGQPNDEARAEEVGSASDGTEQVVEAFAAIGRALSSSKITSTSQLIPITSMIEETLQAADQGGIQWRRSPAAVKAVGETLAMVQSIQSRIESQPQQASEVEKILRSALRQLQQQPPANVRDLSQYIEILDEMQELQDNLTREDLIAYQELQKAVLAHHKHLSQRPTAMTELSPRSSTESSLKSPQYATAVPPNTPATRADSVDQPPALVRDEDEDDGTEDEEGAEDEPNPIPEEEQVIARMLFQMIDKLQKQRFNSEELSAFEKILGRLRSQSLHEEVCQVLSIAEELVGIHRSQNVADQLKSARAGSEVPPTGDTRLEAEALDEDDVEEGVPDGYANELALLPRILERLALPDFVQTTTLFEIKCISKILSQLSLSSDVRSNENLLEAVERAKVLFSEHMQKYNGSAKESASVLVPTILTGMDVESRDGHQLRQFTVAGGEEAEEYTVNETFLGEAFKTSADVVPVDENTKAKWEGRSRALLFCVQQYPDGAANETALSELMMLHDTLDRHHGFDIISVVDDQLSIEEARQLIRDVVEEKPPRLLIYFHSPMPPCVTPAPHALTFADNTVLFHSDVFALCDGVEHVVIIHDRSKGLDVVASTAGQKSRSLSVALTDGAAQVANTSRCWLFDGIFTPLVAELLGRDDESGTTLCPEDVVNFAITSLTAKPIALGKTYTMDSALGTGFWVTRGGIA